MKAPVRSEHIEYSETLKALAHPVRLRIVEGLLSAHECHVDKIVRGLGLPQSTISQHLGVLRSRGIVQVRKQGVRTCYRVVHPAVPGILRSLGLLGKKVGVVLFAVLTVTLLSAAPVSAGELSFSGFAAKVLAHYPKLKLSGADVELGWAQKMQASAGFWPSVSLSAGITETDDPVNVFGLLMRQERFTQADFDLNRLNTPRHQRDIEGGVHIRWPLFDAMQTVRRTRAARQQVKAVQQDALFARMDAFLMAHDAFVNALAIDRMLAAAVEADRSAKEDLMKAEALKNKGLAQGADLYAAKVRAGRFAQAKNELLRQAKAVRMLLNIMMGEPVSRELSLPGALPRAEFGEWAPEPLIKAAQASRPDLVAAATRVKVRLEESKGAKESSLPSVVVTADGTNNRHDLNDRGGNNAAAGIKVEFPLFDAAREGRVKEASARLARARHELEWLKDNAARDIIREAARFEALRVNYPVLKAMADDAQRAVELIVPLYNEGRKSIIDLEDARDARLSALTAFEDLKAALFSSEARLFFLGGRMSEDGMKELSRKIEGGL